MKREQQTIWLVDDDEEDIAIIQHAFSSTYPEIPIQSLHDGDELLPALEATTILPDLILLDLNMIRLDGLETLAALQEAFRFHTIPVVVLTTSDNPEDQALSTALGAQDYHIKPFLYQQMIALTHQIAKKWLA